MEFFKSVAGLEAESMPHPIIHSTSTKSQHLVQQALEEMHKDSITSQQAFWALK